MVLTAELHGHAQRGHEQPSTIRADNWKHSNRKTTVARNVVESHSCLTLEEIDYRATRALRDRVYKI